MKSFNFGKIVFHHLVRNIVDGFGRSGPTVKEFPNFLAVKRNNTTEGKKDQR